MTREGSIFTRDRGAGGHLPGEVLRHVGLARLDAAEYEAATSTAPKEEERNPA
ncbi:hypothetical protein [Streptomyces sp. NPDC058545]|uniref:hypothetical protein n=1 Tax=Streptomyces sp. NPDC058545 TaxID=3346544 RepID=UPI0036619EFA